MASVYGEITDLGADLWTIAPQDSKTNQALRERRSLPFPILADHEQTVIQEWGIFDFDDPKERAIPRPATFIINQTGIVEWSHVGKSTRDRPMPGAILAKVRDVVEKREE